MVQFARPVADLFNEGWTTQAGGSVGIFSAIDEVVQDNDDYIQSASAPTQDVYVTQLGAIEFPAVSTGHIIRYAYDKNVSGGAQIDLTVQLRVGYVSEAALGTLVAVWSHTSLTNTIITASQTLSGGEVSNIGGASGYSGLSIRFLANQILT